MPVNKVIYGSTTLIDLTDATATADKILSGYSAYGADGSKLTGTASGGGSVTITDEANATGITCVITTSSEPTPSSDIPLNTELIDYTKVVSDYALDSSGDAISQQYYYLSDYTKVASDMTFSYTAGYWTYIGLYDSNKTAISTIGVYQDGTADQSDSNTAHGTLSGSKLPSNVEYVRISSTGNYSSKMSLIRTA